ncbi:C-type lectin domain family 2 member D-related protein isoform X1 [Rattus norvegicus]|uniref:C-type lectin domain family 2 member D-related protein n=1 Tax=Rattus norvegicus TaxID=10116 RepID=CL2DR_RAT|nr:C-type lectin domain family 2 member D-related protein [Rattus norvegicus]XP_038964141.1 C-type lectin domain family 2 member D-related protein isoform X1 [Rattus norvegicus]XP_038964142.1 C-type lectin domain family 2 member D-related protein isoform X1 [Rattus norvegicus]Q5M9I1.1 RecName: Full=C-type lectin domain family 2 member D-related protein [Rattus norvegicus]AAH86997.1 Similar to osteoclast inhibitory lectin [Rattus norvegicus]|eukprot:NP_001019508.1 C-type lectin domain family 2 member D-related protein [Rattus norvegicus]
MPSSAHLQDPPPHLSRTLTQDEEQTSLRQSSSCGPSTTSASASESLSGSTKSRISQKKLLEGMLPKIIPTESAAKLLCCYAVFMALTVVVIALSIALSVKKTPQISAVNTYAACQRNWIGFGNKCYYFNETARNWTFSQTLCKEQEAELARFDNEEELNFLKRYKGSSGYWIGLHRESSADPWKWTDNTAYNNLVPIKGEEKHGFLSDNGLSSGKDYIKRKSICSKLNSYTSQCP